MSDIVMNLMEDRWVPVRRRDGSEEKIAPYELTSAIETNPVVSIASPRPDFDAGLMQFFIGLLQTVVPPLEGEDWDDWLDEPPSEAELRERFLPYRDCFNLGGDGPRFMQDLELDQEVKAMKVGVRNLLIDSPGEKTIKKNADHFLENKERFEERGGVGSLCCSCVASALFTLQTNAPSGGQGHRTSLRGGGPLTTLILFPDSNMSLWKNLWWNVRVGEGIEKYSNDERYKVVPWLRSTMTSEKNAENVAVYPVNKHVDNLQMYWGMPRRIRLNFDYDGGVCDLCFDNVDVLVRDYQNKNYGMNYDGWRHFLTPYQWRKDKEKRTVLFPVLMQSDTLTYRYWHDFVNGKGESQKNGSIEVAGVVEEWKKRLGEELYLWSFGYDLKEKAVNNWYEAKHPLYCTSDWEDVDLSNELFVCVEKLVEGAEWVVGLVLKNVRDALGREDRSIRRQFYEDTERIFFSKVKGLYDLYDAFENGNGCDGVLGEKVLQEWYKVIKRKGVSLFENNVLRGDYLSLRGQAVEQIVKARNELMKGLNGKKLRGILSVVD